jgi:ACR3 family arsenite efflux pump ArsB
MLVARITGQESEDSKLTTVVGVLIEVPVMLLVVKVVNNSKGWYERG